MEFSAICEVVPFKPLPSGDCSYDQEGFFARDYWVGQGGVGAFVGEIFLAGEEAQEGAALPGAVIADRALEHWIALFQGVEHGALRDRPFDFDPNFVANVAP